jgi:hypothetical protein
MTGAVVAASGFNEVIELGYLETYESTATCGNVPCWISASISRINGDNAFGVAFQDVALVDVIDNNTLPNPIKGRRAPTVTATDDSKEGESDCDEGSDYDESDCDAEADGRRRRLMRLRTPALKEPEYHVFSFHRDYWKCWCERAS